MSERRVLVVANTWSGPLPPCCVAGFGGGITAHPLVGICQSPDTLLAESLKLAGYMGGSLYIRGHSRLICRNGVGNDIAPCKASYPSSRAAAFSRCGNVFFPLRQLFGLQSWTFSAAGLFLPRPVFFLPRTGFFPPRTVFSRCLQNAFFLLQRCFCAAARCFFSAALNFSRCEAAFFAGVFSRCRNSFFPLQGVFFLLPNVFFPFRCFFPAANLCFSRAARRQGARERRVIHWAFATCKPDSAWTNRWQRRPNIETTVREWKVEACSGGRSDMFQR